MTTITVPNHDHGTALRPTDIHPLRRSREEHAALAALLRASRDAEAAVPSAARREAFRLTRSLLAAARVLGFTLPELAGMLGVTEGSVRTRSGVFAPIPRARFRALVPDTLTSADVDEAVRGEGADASGGDGEEDPVQLLTWYLSAAFVGHHGDAA